MSKTKAATNPGTIARQIIEQAENNYYSPIDKLVAKAREFCLKLKEQDEEQMASVYTALCLSLLSEIQHLTETRRSVTVPFVAGIEDKYNTGHNCLTCGQDCGAKYDDHIAKIEGSHYKISDLEARLTKVAPPLYGEDGLPAVYKLVRKEMVKLITLIYELFYFEESSLIPVILEGKKITHATNGDH